MALVMRKFKRFYKKNFIKRGKNPPFRKGGQSSSLFKARCFKCNSTDHLVTDCSKAIEKEKGALEEKLEALKKKKKGKGLIGAWDQDTSESEGDEKGNICFMALENEKIRYNLHSLTLLVSLMIFVMIILVLCLLKCMVNAKRFLKETKN
ncbi:hypothetical protein M9H77_34663 [Catharanthus roseus]|uniref:Uncharacterized protein n=1 Tax=Catharanthus roseus TaxID=4058 RepID=A0ACB9ZMI6_CATRO|nr:hypothetical protein M9H77_34663 [Catharanthus roseus]